MTPPRYPDAPPEAEYQSIVAEVAELQGVINVAEARLVALTVRAIELGVSGGSHLSPTDWVAWRAGMAPERAGRLVKLAERAGELPHTMAALAAGSLSVDQAAEVARHVPARYDESAARVASCCTVKQLRQALPCYRDPKPAKPGDRDREERSVSSGFDDRGYFCRIRLTAAEGAVHDQALKAKLEDLRRQARSDAVEGADPVPVYAADAVVAIDEDTLAAGEAARPGSDRYLVHLHLEAGPHGLQLMTHLGIVLPDAQRRHLLCDTRLRAIVHDGTTAIGAGRITRTINRRLRRAVEHRDRGCCSVPGCTRTWGLEIHHIVHWEDGGVTETPNLLTLCGHHHRSHHLGTLGIAGNADLPRHTEPGVVFTNRWGHHLDPTGQPTRPTPPPPGADPATRVPAAAAGVGIAPHTYTPPTGERLDRWGFHLQADPPDPPDHPRPASRANNAASTDDDGPDPDDGPQPPPPPVTGHRPGTVPPPPTAPHAPGNPDPTRAGPTTD